MSSTIFNRLRGSSASLALTAAMLFAGTANGQQLAAATEQFGSTAAGGIETVVVTGTAFNAEVAPAKASLETMEPQTIINRSYIEDSVAETADYTTILAIAPGLTGMDVNGPGLSDGNVKNTLRGIPDGSYGITYDGIPFGDTNGPSHHSESYFPSSTIGSIDVDRGPGNAGNLGAATFGGSINMFSEALLAERRLRASATYGSWNTTNFNANYQSGDLDFAGTTRVLANYQDTNSDGYLTLQSTAHSNQLIKVQNQFAPGWTLTVFADHNGLFQHLNDNNGATPAQILAYGKNFALQDGNPNIGTYVGYNVVHKNSDNDYVRLQGDLGGGFTIDNTAYTYAYVNKTMTATSPQQTAADIAAGKGESAGTIVGGVKYASDVQGYFKKNAYRVWGNILRVAKDFDFDWLTGQFRAGVWWEAQATQRARYDFDISKCVANGCDVWHPSSSLAYADSTLQAKGKAVLLPDGYAEYQEHSGWNQYQPFFELELHLLDGLTLTPGFKYVHWEHDTNALIEPKSSPLRPFIGSFTTDRSLPFLMANYKIEQSWSVYAQYAQGIYVPDVSAFEQKTPTIQFPKPETTTNYQVGTVYYADNFTFDADLYYIGVNNNYVSEPCNTPPLNGSSGETCFVNTSTAIYKGVEAEGTYAFGNDFGGLLNGLAAFVNGSLGSSKSSGRWIKQAPMWTAAGGLIYKRDDFKVSLIDKWVGQQYSDNSNTQFYKLPAYTNVDLKGSYTWSNYEFGVGVYNLLNSRNILAYTINDSGAPAGSARDLTGPTRAGSLDQYYFQPSRSFQMTIKATF